MITIELYPRIDEQMLPDEVYEAMTRELHTLLTQEFPMPDLFHDVVCDATAILLTLWKVAPDERDPICKLDEQQVAWLTAQCGFVWGVQDQIRDEHLSMYHVNDGDLLPHAEMTCPRLDRLGAIPSEPVEVAGIVDEPFLEKA